MMMMMMMHGSLPDDLFSRRFRNEAFAGARHTLGYPYSTHTMVTMVIMVIKVVTMVTMVIMVIKVIMVIIITLHHHRQRTLTKWSPLTYIVSRPIDDLCHWYLGIGQDMVQQCTITHHGHHSRNADYYDFQSTPLNH